MDCPVRSIIFAFVCLAVEGAQAQPLNKAATDITPVLISMVSESTYTQYIKGLESFGTRHALQPTRDTVATWIALQFLNAGFTDVVRDSFIHNSTDQWNVVATLPGTEPAAGEIVIGAHYDSQSFNPFFSPGADDNASGTSAVLEIARVLKAGSYAPRRTLRLIAFGAEEMGLKGSEWYASRLVYAQRTVSFMINFDMIGTRFANSPDRDVKIVWYDGAYDEARLDSTLLATYTTLTPILTTQNRFNSDSWSFAQRGIKSVFHIESDFSLVYHTPNDSVYRLDLEYATENVKGGLAMYVAQDVGVISHASRDELPETWTLEQNYPNPFNPTTKLGYRTKEAGAVRLAIYDLLGREVAVLVDEEKPAGTFTVTWNARGMASGQYFARLEGGGMMLTRPMLLIK